MIKRPRGWRLYALVLGAAALSGSSVVAADVATAAPPRVAAGVSNECGKLAGTPFTVGYTRPKGQGREALREGWCGTVRKVTAAAIAEWPRSRPLEYSFVVASGGGTRTFDAIINPARGVEILGFKGVALLIEQMTGKPRAAVAKGPVSRS